MQIKSCLDTTQTVINYIQKQNLESSQEIHITFKVATIGLMADFSTEIMVARKEHL